MRYAQSGAEAAARSRGTAGVWLASNEARALAALNQLDDAHAALTRAADARAEALAPVLELPPAKRIHGIVTSVEHVRTALRSVQDPGRRSPGSLAPSRAGPPSV